MGAPQDIAIPLANEAVAFAVGVWLLA